MLKSARSPPQWCMPISGTLKSGESLYWAALLPRYYLAASALERIENSTGQYTQVERCQHHDNKSCREGSGHRRFDEAFGGLRKEHHHDHTQIIIPGYGTIDHRDYHESVEPGAPC